ncbi:TMEM175 family protein [Erythrobacter sp. NE805]|uniref:TMEM175 family protein n=1 Tax=Erythrobacter sp. NE805 TaxID=3389875 RepID=UPI00396AF341
MGEPESLAEVEPLEEHIRRHSYDRLIMLSDGVYAIATTLAAIEVKLPHGETLSAMLRAGQGQLGAYALSFLLTAVYWLQHRDLFARLQRADQAITLLTLAQLCLVALIPAAIHAVYSGGISGGAFQVYLVLVAVIGLVNFGMWAYAEARGTLFHPAVPRLYRWQRLVTTGSAPVLLLPALLLPLDEAGYVILPGALALLALRSGLLPRIVDRHPQHMA